MWDSENIAEYIEREQERWERLHRREEVEENKEAIKMRFWKDMSEDERRNASPSFWDAKEFWDDGDVFERIDTDAHGCEWNYIAFPSNEQIKQAGGNEN